MAKFDVLSLFGVNIDFAYFNVFELIETLGLHSVVLNTDRVANLIKKHGKKHPIVSVVIRQVALSELKPALDNPFLPHSPSFLENPITTSAHERRYEAEEKLLLLCLSLALGKSVVGVRRLNGADFSKTPREFQSKGRGLYAYFRQLLNDHTRDYVMRYKDGKTGDFDNADHALPRDDASMPAPSKGAHTAEASVTPVAFSKEVQTALDLVAQGVTLMTEQVKKVLSGERLDTESLNQYCRKLGRSYDRNPNALLVVRHIQDSKDYLAQHGVACAILACHMGKCLKLEERFVQVMTLGALLFDMGRFKLPEVMAKKTGKLTEAEYQLVRKHLMFGEAFLKANDDIPKVVYQMLWEHHERIDGAGYPQGKIDQEISAYGKIGAIIDAYDALTSGQSHRQALTPTEALDKMLKESGFAFDRKLLAFFIASLGPVPVGSCVALNNGRVAFVLTVNNALQPALVRQVYSVSSKAFIPSTDLTLYDDGDIHIAKVVSPSTYDLSFIDHIR